MENILTSLCSSGTVSGNELVDLDIIKELMPDIEIETDYNNNIIATMGNKSSEDVILLDAHNDRIGFVVSYIDDEGFIKISNCGGIDRRVLLGSEVTVMGKKPLHGIVCCLPPHLSDGGEDKAPSADSIYIDTGLCKAEVTELVSLGDNVVALSKPKRLIGSRFTAGSLDNKAGVASLIRVAHILADKKLDCCVKLLFSSQEETGFLGSRTASFAIKPSCAIVVDVSFATQPMVAPEKCGELSKGPMLGIAPVLDKEMFAELKNLSQENNIPYQIEVMSSTTGTNADAITTTASGVRTALVSIPLRNMHTQAELVDMEDIEKTAELIALYIMKRGAKNE